MKNQINEILRKYTVGEIALELANADLKAAGSNLYLDLQKNVLTQSEIAETVVGKSPEDATGMGLLDTGTGSLDKVFVENGKLADVDCGDMEALCIIGGKAYHVRGTSLLPDKIEWRN